MDECKELPEKVMKTMMYIASLKDEEDTDRIEKVKSHIRDTFTYEELIHVASTHIGEHMAKILQERPEAVQLFRAVAAGVKFNF